MTAYPWADAAVWHADDDDGIDDLTEDEQAITGTCPWCGPAVFVELPDDEIETAPTPESGEYLACVRCGCYPAEGSEVSRPIDRVPTWEEYAARGLPTRRTRAPHHPRCGGSPMSAVRPPLSLRRVTWHQSPARSRPAKMWRKEGDHSPRAPGVAGMHWSCPQSRAGMPFDPPYR
jgi:hypothetical protein